MCDGREEGIMIRGAGGQEGEKPVETGPANRRCADARYSGLWRPGSARCDRESRVFRDWVAGDRIVDIASYAAHTCPKRVDQCGTKNMGFFGAGHLATRKNLMRGVQERVGL